MYDKFGRKALRRKPDGHCVLVQALVSWSVARGDADAPLAYKLVRLLQRTILTTTIIASQLANTCYDPTLRSVEHRLRMARATHERSADRSARRQGVANDGVSLRSLCTRA